MCNNLWLAVVLLQGCGNFNPTFITKQGMEVVLDGVDFSKKDVETMYEIVATHATKEEEKEVRRRARKWGEPHTTFTSTMGVCGERKAYGCYSYQSIRIFVDVGSREQNGGCLFYNSFSHEFAHFILDVTTGSPRGWNAEEHGDEKFCQWPESCYEEDTQQAIEEALCTD